MKHKCVSSMFFVLALTSGYSVAYGKTVKITPLGQRTGEFCFLDRANPRTRTERFMELVGDVPVFLPLSGVTMEFVAASIVLSMSVFGAFFYIRGSRRVTEKDTLVLADFKNTTRDAVFDDALKQALSVQLQQSPFLNIASDAKIASTLRMMGREKDEWLTQDVAREGGVQEFIDFLKALRCHRAGTCRSSS